MSDLSAEPARCCRKCEYWDVGGMDKVATALMGDCLNPNSDRFTPGWDHVCKAFYPATTEAAE